MKMILKAKAKKKVMFVALLWKTSAHSIIGCILAMQHNLHSWKATIKLILYFQGWGEGKQKLGQVGLINQCFLLACPREPNFSFVALATTRTSACGLQASMSTCKFWWALKLQHNFSPQANTCKWAKVKENNFSLKNTPSCSTGGGSKGSSSAIDNPSRPGDSWD